MRNEGEQSRRVSIDLAPIDVESGNRVTPFEADAILEPGDSIDAASVIRQQGTYEIRVQTAGATTTYEWVAENLRQRSPKALVEIRGTDIDVSVLEFV